MLGRVNTPPEEFENGGFNLKTHQIFFVHTTPEEFENGNASNIFCLLSAREEFETEVSI